MSIQPNSLIYTDNFLHYLSFNKMDSCKGLAIKLPNMTSNTFKIDNALVGLQQDSTDVNVKFERYLDAYWLNGVRVLTKAFAEKNSETTYFNAAETMFWKFISEYGNIANGDGGAKVSESIRKVVTGTAEVSISDAFVEGLLTREITISIDDFSKKVNTLGITNRIYDYIKPTMSSGSTMLKSGLKPLYDRNVTHYNCSTDVLQNVNFKQLGTDDSAFEYNAILIYYNYDSKNNSDYDLGAIYFPDAMTADGSWQNRKHTTGLTNIFKIGITSNGTRFLDYRTKNSSLPIAENEFAKYLHNQLELTKKFETALIENKKLRDEIKALKDALSTENVNILLNHIRDGQLVLNNNAVLTTPMTIGTSTYPVGTPLQQLILILAENL